MARAPADLVFGEVMEVDVVVVQGVARARVDWLAEDSHSVVVVVVVLDAAHRGRRGGRWLGLNAAVVRVEPRPGVRRRGRRRARDL